MNNKCVRCRLHTATICIECYARAVDDAKTEAVAEERARNLVRISDFELAKKLPMIPPRAAKRLGKKGLRKLAERFRVTLTKRAQAKEQT